MKSELKIHTQMGPAPSGQRAAPEEQPQSKRVLWKPIGHPRGGWWARWKASAPGDRLLRNTAIACALLLGVMTLRNADLPWTQRAVEGIEKALTMRIDLDESLGKLHFVRELVPEAALVFWNSGTERALEAPVEGSIEHEYSEKQPWRVYACAQGDPVCAALDGVVSRVEQGAMADYIVLVEHDDGLESVYAYMSAVDVQQGEKIYAGQQLGTVGEGGRIYFALRREGEPADPGGYE